MIQFDDDKFMTTMTTTKRGRRVPIVTYSSAMNIILMITDYITAEQNVTLDTSCIEVDYTGILTCSTVTSDGAGINTQCCSWFHLNNIQETQSVSPEHAWNIDVNHRLWFLWILILLFAIAFLVCSPCLMCSSFNVWTNDAITHE